MTKIVDVVLCDKEQVLYFDRAIESIDYDEAIVQGIRFPAKPVLQRLSDRKTLVYSKTETAVVADWRDYPEEFFLNQNIDLVKCGEEPKKKKKWFW